MAIVFLLGLLCVTWPTYGQAEDRLVKLHAPAALVDSGVLKYSLPRFSLKTQVRVELVETPETAQITLGPTGRPLFEGLGQVWHMDLRDSMHPGTVKLAAWLTSDVGRRTVQGYAPDGAALFGPPKVAAVAAVVVEMDGDAILGHEVSLAKCTRCHAVDEATRSAGIGSTPSFAVLRSLRDWEDRFSAFYALKPHAAFTQIAEVTEPFPDNLPSPIVPIELTLDEVEAVLAYVATMAAADLGAPLDHQ